jgi:hypothetical protein
VVVWFALVRGLNASLVHMWLRHAVVVATQPAGFTPVT